MPDDAAPDRPEVRMTQLADRCVQCGLCLPHCPTYRLDATEAESPRGRIAYMKALSTGLVLPSAIGDQHLDNCLGCQRCEQACPAGVSYGALLAGTRGQQFSRRTEAATSTRLRSLLTQPRRLTALLALFRQIYRVLPAKLRPLPRPPAAVRYRPDNSAKVAVFIGCIARSYESPSRAALFRLLAAADIKACLPDQQTCCGTAAYHAGDRAQAMLLAQRNRAAMAGVTTLVCMASGCQQTLSDSLSGTCHVLDAFAFLDQHSARFRFTSAHGRKVALHIPCSQHSDVSSVDAMRRLLSQIPELVIVELTDSGCCGAAGLHMLTEPERANALRAPLLAELAKSGVVEVLSANIGCRLHLANAAKLAVRHPIEILSEFLA